VIISFKTKELRALCESLDAAIKAFGAEIAHPLIRRLADLQAAQVLGELPVGNPRPTGHGEIKIDVGEEQCLVIHPLPLDKDVDAHWDSIDRILILEITEA